MLCMEVSSLQHTGHICTLLYFDARQCLHGLQGLDLRAQFKSEEDMLQYIAGFWEADGGMVMMNGSLRLYFHQSNRVFLKALKAEYGASGVYCELPENDGTVEWGKYSNGELPQRLRYDNADAIRVLNTFAPYVVSKLYHISLAEEWQTLHASPASPARTKALQLLQASISAANHGIGAIPPATQSITAAWLGGLFDGDGSVTVNINKSPRRAMRGLLTLAVGQPKCVALLPAIQKKFGGNSFTGSCEVRWESRKSLPPIFEVLYPHIVMKRQKLRCLLKNMFDVNLEARPIEGKGNAGAFSCVPPSREWTASKWREYLGTETLLPWSR